MRRLLIIVFVFSLSNVFGQSNPTSLTIQKDLRVQGQTVLGGVAKERDITMTADTIRIKGLDGTGNYLYIDANGDVTKATPTATVTGLTAGDVLYGGATGGIEQDLSGEFQYDETTNTLYLQPDGVTNTAIINVIDGTNQTQMTPAVLFAQDAADAIYVYSDSLTIDKGGNYTNIKRTSGGTSHSLIFPNAQGGANTFLKNDGSGNLSWAAGGGGSYTFSTGLTDAAGTITANLSTGVSGGQSVIGGTAASNSLTLSSTSNATKGKLLFGSSAYDEANNRLGIQQASPTSKLQVNHDANSITINDANGLFLANATAAIAGTQSASPPIVLQGNGWKTNAPAASQDVRFRMYVLPTQSTTNPIGFFIIQSSINNAAYQDRLTLTSTGVLAASNLQASSVSSASQILGGSTTTGTQVYRTTNGGSNVSPAITSIFSFTAGALGTAIDNTNGFVLSAGNGTRHIARAAINITNLTNTAGSESGDLAFYTQSGGTAISEKMRIFAAGNVAINTTTNAGFRFDVNGTGRFQSELTTTGNLVAYVSKTGAYTATSTDETIAADATTAAFQVTLPTASGRTGQRYTIKKTDSSANAVTVGTTSSQTIDGSTTYSLATQWKYVTVVSNGSNWLIISNN